MTSPGLFEGREPADRAAQPGGGFGEVSGQQLVDRDRFGLRRRLGGEGATLGDAPNAPAAQLTGLAARTHARLGQHDLAGTELNTAPTIFSNLTATQTNEPFFGFPPAEMTMYSSQVLSRIDDPKAWDEQTKALAGYPDNDPMDRPLILLDRARYIAGQGDPSQAATIAITALPAELRVPLLLTQTRQIADLIAHRSPHAAADLREKALITQ